MARRREKTCFQEYEEYLMEEMEEENRLWDEECAYWEQKRDYEEYKEQERLEQEAQLEAEGADIEFLIGLCSEEFLEECLYNCITGRE